MIVIHVKCCSLYTIPWDHVRQCRGLSQLRSGTKTTRLDLEKDHGWSFRKHFLKVRKRGGLGWNDNIMVSYGHGHTTLNHICNVHAPTSSGHFQVYWIKTLCAIWKKSLNQKVFIQHLVLISWGDFLVAMCLNVSERSVVDWGSHDCSLFSRQGLKMSGSLQR